MVFGCGYHDGVDIDTGNLNETGVNTAVIHHLLHLDDDLAAGVLGSLRDGQRLTDYALSLKGAVALRIGIGGTDDGHVNGVRVIK